MKLKILQGNDQSAKYIEVDGQQITKNFALYDDFGKGKRTYKIDHIKTGRTICRRTFASPDVAETLCQLFEDAFGSVLDAGVNGIIKEDLQKHGTLKKYLAYGLSVLLEEQDNPISFSKYAKAKRQAEKDLGYVYKSK